MIAQLNYPQVWMLILAWFLADLGVPMIIRLSHRVGALDKPHTYKTHQEPVALLGGVGIYLAFMITLVSVLRFPNPGEFTYIFAIVAGGFLVLVLGVVDGFRPIWAVAKLGVLLLVTLLLSRFGVRISLTGVWAADLALTLAWIAGVSSAMNSMDNMDGAAGGTAAIASFWTFYVAWYTAPWGQPHVSFVAIARGVVKNPLEAIVFCGRDHLSHRLVALGLSKREAVLVIYLFGMISGAVAVIIVRPEVKPALYIPIASISVLLLISFGVLLDRAKVYPHQQPQQPAPGASHEAVTS